MSSNAKQQAKGNPSAAVFQQGQRNLKKRDFKQALKDARVCYRQSPIAEHRILLEQASLGRARELDLAGLKPQAQDILQELLAQPVVDSEVRQGLPELLSRLAMLERYPEYRERLDADPELKAKLVTRAADMAVLHLNDAKNAAPEIRHGAALVLASLDKLDAGQEADSLELLKDISRQSPFADWRLFVRGLAAHNRRDQVNADANWSRLDPDRIPARLTRLLKAIRESDVDHPLDPSLANAFGALEAGLWGAPLLSDLRHLKARAAANDWFKAVAILRNMRDRLRVADPATLEAITGYLVNEAINTKNRELLKELTFSTDPLPWDPNWNHARAQISDLDYDIPSKEQVQAWLKYFADLDQVRCGTAEEIVLAKAIVMERIGKIYANLASETSERKKDDREAAPVESDEVYDGIDWDWDSEYLTPPRAFFERRAEQAYSQSLALRPDLLETHLAMCSLWSVGMNAEKAVEARLALLAQFPNHLDSLYFLVLQYQTMGRLDDALACSLRMLQAKPLDEGYRQKSWDLRMCLARLTFRAGDWAATRDHLTTAESLNASPAQEYLWLVRSAILEQQIGNLEQSQVLLDRAQQTGGSGVVVWFAMTVEAGLLGLPTQQFREYEARLLAGLQEPFDLTAAGLLAGFAVWILQQKQTYLGQVKHFKAVADYLKLGKKSRFDLEPLRNICLFLMSQKGNKGLTEHYLSHGRGRFRQSGFFSGFLGLMNFEQGPKKCNRDYALQLLKDAQQKIVASQDPVERTLLPRIEQAMAILEDMERYIDQFEDYGFNTFMDDMVDDEPIAIEEFTALMRREFNRQLSRRLKPGMTMENVSEKTFAKIMTPAVMEEIFTSLSRETGLSIDQIADLFERYSTFQG